jgi:HAD superfamily phosphatase
MAMKGVLFDMDGVLVDVSRSYRLAIKKTAEYFLGQDIHNSLIQKYKNRGGFNNDWDLTEKILNDNGKKIKKEMIINLFQRLYLGENHDGLIRNEEWLLDRNILERIKKNFKLGIVTGRPYKEACYALERFNMKIFFPVIIALEDVPVHRSKPDPLGILLALKKLRIHEAFYVGDTVDDIKAARRANTVPIGVINDSSFFEEQYKLFLNQGAQCIIKDINDLEEVLE